MVKLANYIYTCQDCGYEYFIWPGVYEDKKKCEDCARPDTYDWDSEELG